VLRAANVPPVQPGAFGMAMPPAYGDSGAAVEVLVEDLPGLKAAVMHRPKALNAMNTTMVERLTELYTRCACAHVCVSAGGVAAPPSHLGPLCCFLGGKLLPTWAPSC
jgi:hypothetical protein